MNSGCYRHFAIVTKAGGGVHGWSGAREKEERREERWLDRRETRWSREVSWVCEVVDGSEVVGNAREKGGKLLL